MLSENKRLLYGDTSNLQKNKEAYFHQKNVIQGKVHVNSPQPSQVN